MYIYEGHLGSLYTSEYPIDYDDLYCERCGDSDDEIGNFETAKDFLIYMADDIDANDGWGGWDINYVMEALCCFDDVPSLEEAIELVKEYRTIEERNDD